jgi:hypothetical protein
MRPPPKHTRWYAIVEMVTRRKELAWPMPPFFPCGASRQRFPCAAPRPSLALTGAWSPCRPLFESAGRRGRRRFSVAEDAWPRQSSSAGRQHLNKCVVQPHDGRASSRKLSQDMRPTVDCPGAGMRKKSKSPLVGEVCLLTRGCLISVRGIESPTQTLGFLIMSLQAQRQTQPLIDFGHESLISLAQHT